MKAFKVLDVCACAGSIMPAQVSNPAGKRLSGLCDEWAQHLPQERHFSTEHVDRWRPPVAQRNTDTGTTIQSPHQQSFNTEDSYLIDLTWLFFLIQQEVSVKNHKISTLELEKDALLEQLDDL